jgi:hypothetical protein
MTKTELDKLVRQSNSKSLAVRRKVAENPNCPAEILDRLIRDEERWIRQGIAGNPNCPVEALDRLSRDVDEDVRYEVAGNPNCPDEALVRLSGDEDSDVCEAAVKELSSRKENRTPEEKELIGAYELLLEIGVI